jgi:hypothetical protein
MAAVALALGAVATSLGLGPAVNLGAAVNTLLSIATPVRALATRADGLTSLGAGYERS